MPQIMCVGMRVACMYASSLHTFKSVVTLETSDISRRYENVAVGRKWGGWLAVQEDSLLLGMSPAF